MRDNGTRRPIRNITIGALVTAPTFDAMHLTDRLHAEGPAAPLINLYSHRIYFKIAVQSMVVAERVAVHGVGGDRSHMRSPEARADRI